MLAASVWKVAAQRLGAARPRSGLLIDGAIAAAALVATLAQLSHGLIGVAPHGPDELDWAGGVLAACSTLPLVAWRHAPRAVLALTASVTVLLVGLGYTLALPLGPAAALYLLAASRDDGGRWTQRDTGMVLGLFGAYLGAAAVGNRGFPDTELLHGGLSWAIAWFAGERTRLRREHLTELRERALRVEREGERERRLAIAEERARIARDLHDAAGHAINVIAVRAGTARMRSDPARSQVALEAIEELARKTVGEIDQIVGTLRDPGPAAGDVDAPPGLASLDTLVGQHAAAGLEVSVATAGQPRRLESAVDQAAYRILQEALTNAARHGTGPTKLELAFGEDALRLTISNAEVRAGGSRSNGGHGLIGMRERATLVGGTLEVERSSGRFALRASLPYRGPRA